MPALGLAFSGVGALIASRQPDNAIGWLFLGIGATTGLGCSPAPTPSAGSPATAGSAPLGEAAAAYGSMSWIPFILVPSTFLLLLFPDGHLLSRRWRPSRGARALGIAGALRVAGP